MERAAVARWTAAAGGAASWVLGGSWLAIATSSVFVGPAAWLVAPLVFVLLLVAAALPVFAIVAALTRDPRPIVVVYGGLVVLLAPCGAEAWWTERVLARTAARTEPVADAVEAFRARHGELPPSLDALVPDALDAAPTFPSPGGAPLGFRAIGAVVGDKPWLHRGQAEVLDGYCLYGAYGGAMCMWCSNYGRPIVWTCE